MQYCFSPKASSTIAEFFSEILVGAKTVDEFSEAFSPVWDESVEYLTNGE
jgi:hypothetical protein